MDVETNPGIADDTVDHRPTSELGEPRAPRRAEHDLRRVERVRRRHQGLADVRADNLAIGSAELLDELALAVESFGGSAREPVLRTHVDGEEITF
jgi:hypothetical protein